LLPMAAAFCSAGSRRSASGLRNQAPKQRINIIVCEDAENLKSIGEVEAKIGRSVPGWARNERAGERVQLGKCPGSTIMGGDWEESGLDRSWEGAE
jgi:hypothetical protein